MFSEPYMQRALVIAVLLAPLCALLGVFVTARRMSFFSDTVAHSALAGVAAGFWLGMPDPTWAMLAVSLLVAGLILWLKEKTQLLTDTIMALLMSSFMALGIVGFSLLKGFRGELHRYLFGDILSVGSIDVGLALAATVVVGGVLFRLLNSLTLLTVQEDLAHLGGYSVRGLNYLFVLLLTAVVALSIRLLGIILVTSLLVIPPATARNLATNFRQHVSFSVLAGLVGGFGGVAASYQFDLPCGPTIVLACSALFLLSLPLATLRRPRAQAS